MTSLAAGTPGPDDINLHPYINPHPGGPVDSNPSDPVDSNFGDPDDINSDPADPDDINLHPYPEDFDSHDLHQDDIALIPKSKFSAEPTSASHKRTGEDADRTKIWALATLPLILHLASVLTLLAVLATYIDHHDFNLHFRHALSNLTPLQSDITTAISSGIVIYRLFASTWSAAMLWRCIFILMGNGGVSLEQIDRLLAWQIHFQPLLKSSHRFGLLISIILLAAFPCQFSGPILTGSVTWSSSHHVSGRQRITGIHSGYTGDLSSYGPPPLFLSSNSLASGFASTAWHDLQGDTRVMKRVIQSLAQVPVNSTLNNVTLPYFAISEIEWVEEPMEELPRAVALALNSTSDQNPFSRSSSYALPGVFALIPDTWGHNETLPSSYDGIVKENRTIFGIQLNNPDSTCPPSPIAKLPPYFESIGVCVVLGHVTFVAGAAECRNCRVSSLLTVQNDSALTVLPSMDTQAAIGMMPMTGAMMAMQLVSLPALTDSLDVYVSELLIRSYAVSWTYATMANSNISMLSTDAQIAIPTSVATVMWWRVWVWLWLNLLFTASGFLFLVAQRMSGQRLVGNPPLASLLLDTSEILHKSDRAFCDFSTMTQDDKGIGYLLFVRDAARGGHRQVEIVEK